MREKILVTIFCTLFITSTCTGVFGIKLKTDINKGLIKKGSENLISPDNTNALEKTAIKYSDLYSYYLDDEKHENIIYMDGAEWEKFFEDDWYHESEYDEWGKIGKTNQIIQIFKLKYDKTNKYDWYTVIWTIQVVQGHVAYNNDWRIADIWNWADGDRYDSYVDLVDYGPFSTQGQTTVGFNVGVEAGSQGAAVTAGISISYTIGDIDVHDETDFSEQQAKWWHNVNEATVGWDKVVTIKPAAVFRVPQGEDLKLNFTTKVCFCTMILGLIIDKTFTQTLWWPIPGIHKNYQPETPDAPSGPSSGKEDTSYEYSVRTIDPDYDDVLYKFNWDDGTSETNYFPSDTTAKASHTWTSPGVYSVQVCAKDEKGTWSDWSHISTVNIEEKSKISSRELSITFFKNFYHFFSEILKI